MVDAHSSMSSLKEERFNALLERLGALEQNEMRDFLDSREVEEPEDAETAALIAEVEEKLAAVES